MLQDLMIGIIAGLIANACMYLSKKLYTSIGRLFQYVKHVDVTDKGWMHFSEDLEEVLGDFLEQYKSITQSPLTSTNIAALVLLKGSKTFTISLLWVIIRRKYDVPTNIEFLFKFLLDTLSLVKGLIRIAIIRLIVEHRNPKR